VSTGIATGRLGPATGLFGVGNPVATLKGIADPSGLAMAAATLVGQLTTPPKPGATLKALNLLKLQNTLAGQIDPVAAIDAQAHARTVRNDGRSGAAPFVVAPSFSQAMSAWLAAMSPAWLLPGLSQVLPNSLALVAVNRRFVEAFMAGLNHEMGRRLIFDEFPTDVAATFFKSFWNDGADDIAPVGTWGVLGYNPPLGAPVGDPLVLVVRGALVRRYPNIQVLAVQATSAGPTRTLGGTETPALFSCRIDPDVAFYGFPLTVEDALGTATTPGYYIVIQEHPSEPRFGGAIPAGSSAAIAAALLQHPVRLAVYAADLLQGVAGGGH
jgi:hypothetical protein